MFEEWLTPGSTPREYDEVYVNRALDRRNGLLAHAHTPAAYLERRTLLNLAPRYAEWAASAGLPLLPKRFSPLDETNPGPRQQTAPRPPLPFWPEARVRLQIVSPVNGLRLVRDPEAPASTGTLSLRVVAQPRMEQVLWRVDGEPFRLADYPYLVRWPLRPGAHRIQAQLPYSEVRSRETRIWVE